MGWGETQGDRTTRGPAGTPHGAAGHPRAERDDAIRRRTNPGFTSAGYSSEASEQDVDDLQMQFLH